MDRRSSICDLSSLTGRGTDTPVAQVGGRVPEVEIAMSPIVKRQKGHPGSRVTSPSLCEMGFHGL